MPRRWLTTCLHMVTLALLVGGVKVAVTSSWSDDLPDLQSAEGVEASERVVISYTYPSTAFLPVVYRAPTGIGGEPIWLDSSEPQSHHVGLFRRDFEVAEEVQDVEVRVFADTRYEIWVDGHWLGRGPARFSQSIREYDVYRLEDLGAGLHLVAALVQWAPNLRRSESQLPFLQASIWGMTASGKRVLIAETDRSWRCMASAAWELQSEPVHVWDLIGPTELMDLGKYESDWVEVAFEDELWSPAVVRGDVLPAKSSRSIPLLSYHLITPTVMGRGLLSPGRSIAELYVNSPQRIDFEVLQFADVRLEMLARLDDDAQEALRVDGEALSWQPVSSARPDVLGASIALSPGPHYLEHSGVPQNGRTFAISTDGLNISLPFDQGLHAGRRLLLAEPLAVSEVVAVTYDPDLALAFSDLPAYAVLDLGRTVHGRLAMELDGPSGAIVDVGWDERLWLDSRPLPYPGSLHPEWNQVDSWVLDGSVHTVTTIDARAGRYLLIAVWGAGPVALRNVRVYEERYPATERGSFDSSDPRLDRIWETGVDTLYPNMTDAYTDTPWRERGQWWGDAYVEYKINQAVFGDTRLLVRGLRLMGAGFSEGVPNAMVPHGDGVHMLDFGMLWVQGLVDYWRMTEDSSLLIELYPALLDFMGYLDGYADENTGLLNLPKAHWSQTVLIDWYAPNSRYGQSTAVNALYYRALCNASEVATALGDLDQAVLWSEQALHIQGQIIRELYNAEQGCFWETLFDDERMGCTTSVGDAALCSPHAQAWALANDVVPASEQSAVARALVRSISRDTTHPNMGTYGMFWVLEALGKTGLHSEALVLLKDLYGGMLDQGASTWWEHFDSDQRYASSLSHGWAGSPTWYLTTYILGARAVGYGTWEVAPAFGDVGMASGSLPLTEGDLGVQWIYESCQHLVLDVAAPVSSTGTVILTPVSSASQAITVTLNGTVIWQDGVSYSESAQLSDDGLAVRLPQGGDYKFVIRRDCTTLYLPMLARDGDSATIAGD